MAEGDVLIRRTAVEVVELLRKGEVTPSELIDAALARIRAVDPAVNALPTLCIEHARDHARRMGGSKSERGSPGWLGGLPIAIKDLMNVTGVRSTRGSPIFADFVPETSDIQVETLERRGGIVVARSNTSEFGAGANTFNEVFGKTRNPWNTALTCGGSSGGSAVALATGMVWLANGSDLGGSLRIPASYCSVVGMRMSRSCWMRWRASIPAIRSRARRRGARSLSARAGRASRRRRASRPIWASCRSTRRCTASPKRRPESWARPALPSRPQRPTSAALARSSACCELCAT
jgi:Asp-tRNA(Asn)/Glu-tRNA(Gln) amidotransferase A subunit family amidase